MALKVSTSSLEQIGSLGVAVPRYDRDALVPRIVHVGVGGFHRAHMAAYLDELAHAGSDWGVRGIGLLDTDRRMARVLASQDHLYTLVERDDDRTMRRVIGSIVDFALPAGEISAFAAYVAKPEVAILSLTITEGGYEPSPNTTLSAVAAALDARRKAGAGGLTVLSCDNLPGNGDVAREAILAACDRRGAELVGWVQSSCAFPNSMVDRITPQTTDADRAWLRDEVGIDDGWPVVCEPFRQWVIEDDFAADRPQLEQCGVLITDRVHDWELYKLRILNATHSCMAYLMALAGIRFVDEAVAVPAVRRYLDELVVGEAIPPLAEIPGHPAVEYWHTVLHRYENAAVRDQIARVCIGGTAKFPSFLVPTIEHQLEHDGPVECAALALAGWAQYLATVPAEERAPDPGGERAAAFATRSLADAREFLEFDEVFTPRLRASERFAEAFASALGLLRAHGPMAAIAAITQEAAV